VSFHPDIVMEQISAVKMNYCKLTLLIKHIIWHLVSVDVVSHVSGDI